MGRIAVIRHGQASFGSDDYDVLSPLGERQAGIVGEALGGFAPSFVVHGTMKRQRDTATIAATAAGWEVPIEVDDAWNEMDHLNVLALMPAPPGEMSRELFQQWFTDATARWQSGQYDADYAEPFPAFWSRVEAGLDRLAHLAERGNVAVFTSGGPIAVVATILLGGDLTTYTRLTPVVVNASITRVITGSTGPTLLTFNEHSHFEGDTRTYR